MIAGPPWGVIAAGANQRPPTQSGNHAAGKPSACSRRWAMEIVLWLACGVMTVIAAVLASRSGRARYVGRAAVGGLFIVGGALVNTINLASGVDYTGFADTAHFTRGRRTQFGYVGVNWLLPRPVAVRRIPAGGW